ncbi:MAG TPA: hypothetical protein VK841_14590 [Polyangiaceae bacterium]|nr:hypothetical protein [Polyangiaceae bacterium]
MSRAQEGALARRDTAAQLPVDVYRRGAFRHVQGVAAEIVAHSDGEPVERALAIVRAEAGYPLSIEHVTTAQVARLFEQYDDDGLPTDFD